MSMEKSQAPEAELRVFARVLVAGTDPLIGAISHSLNLISLSFPSVVFGELSGRLQFPWLDWRFCG